MADAASDRKSSVDSSQIDNNKRLGEFTTVAFSNHVIVDNILQHLDFTCVKALSNVSRALKNIIRRNKEFVEKCKFKFYKTEHKDIDLNPALIEPADFLWKTVAIQIHSKWSTQEFIAILSLIGNVPSIEISANIPCGEAILQLEMLGAILRAIQNVKSLTIDSNVLDFLIPKDFDRVLKAQDILRINLKNLESLWIRNPVYPKGAYKYDVMAGKDFGLILRRLGELPKSLMRFAYDRNSYENIEPVLSANRTALNKSIIPILQKHRESLHTISLSDLVWNFKEILSIALPALKHLSLVAIRKNIPAVGKFLMKQLPLETLKLTFKNWTTMHNELKAPLLKHASQLKLFSLTFFEENRNNNYFPVSNQHHHAFSILQSCENLRVLEIQQQRAPAKKEHGRRFSFSDSDDEFPNNSRKLQLACILSNVPDGIEEIHINGVSSPGELWPSIGKLGKLQNLTTLNLIQCPDAIDDKIFGHICTHMTQLQELGFSHCDLLTDSGLTGRRNGVLIAPGLNALTNLVKLHISSCPLLSRNGLLKVISFPELKELTLVASPREMTKDSYMRLMAQNNSLQVLKIPEWEAELFPELEHALKTKFSKLQALIFIKPLLPYVTPEEDDSEESVSESSDDDSCDYGAFGYNEVERCDGGYRLW